MAKWGFPDMSAEVERLRAELEQARAQLREMALDVLAASGQAQDAYEAQLAAERRADRLEEQLADSEANVAHALCQMRLAKAERDDLAARLQSIQQAERKYTAAKLDEAAKMRKGQAI